MTENKRKRLYKSKLWQKKTRYQREKQPLCEVCLKLSPPVFTKAVASDHLDGFTTEREFYTGKLQSICARHHTEKNQLYDHPKTAQARKTAFKFF